MGFIITLPRRANDPTLYARAHPYPQSVRLRAPFIKKDRDHPKNKTIFIGFIISVVQLVKRVCVWFNDVLVALLLFFLNMSFKFWERLHGGDGALVAGRAATVRGRRMGCDHPRSPDGLRLPEVASRTHLLKFETRVEERY